MRISCNKDDRCYLVHGITNHLKVLFNGAMLINCFTADEELGIVEILGRDDRAERIVEDSRTGTRSFLRGHVEIQVDETGAAPLRHSLAYAKTQDELTLIGKLIDRLHAHSGDYALAIATLRASDVGALARAYLAECAAYLPDLDKPAPLPAAHGLTRTAMDGERNGRIAWVPGSH